MAAGAAVAGPAPRWQMMRAVSAGGAQGPGVCPVHPDGQAEAEVSGCLRTMTGARQFCAIAIRSYLSTAAKHDLGFFDALVMLTGGEPWMPAVA